MSELKPPSALRQLDALAAWVLLGWLGMRLGWSVASGVLPLVVWWAVRVSAVRRHGLRLDVGVAGLWLSMLSLATAASGLASPHGLSLLLIAAAGWGLWSATLSGHAHERTLPLAQLGMGLMMGSLWLSSQWCLGPGWTDRQAVALHLGLMAGLPLAVSLAGRFTGTRLAVNPRHALLLLAAGALLVATAGTPVGHIAGMALVVFAGVLNLQLRDTGPASVLVGLGGPALLLAVGLMAPALGPTALQAAWALVALLATAQALQAAWFVRRPISTPQRWSDAA
jgi:spore maturation protein SpmB